MDQNDLSLTHQKAGREYLGALDSLGLRPSCLFWAWDSTVSQFVLVLVSHAYDYVGPLKLSETLTKAYNKAATPKEINPFMVRMHSPAHTIIREIGKFILTKIEAKDQFASPIEGFATFRTSAADLEVYQRWVYRFEQDVKLPKTVDLSRRWRRFESAVEKLAA